MSKRNRTKVLSHLIVFGCFLVFGIIHYNVIWPYDAGDYWSRGNVIKESGFELKSIDGYRGYIFPLYLGIAGLFGRTGFYILNALLLSLFVTKILPYITYDNYKSSTTREVGLVILLCVFFRGLVFYPLSDMFALTLFSCALFFLKMAKCTKNIYLECIYIASVGFFCYLAYNTRTIYLFSGIGIMLYTAYYLLREKIGAISNKVFKYIRYICFSLVGIIIAAIPQMVVNNHHIGEFSIKVPTNGLMLKQLFWGIQYQRYDTYVPDIRDAMHDAPVFFNDPVGQRLLEVMQIEANTSWADYFKLIIYHPIDVASIYIRHFVNYIFPCWPEVYVKDLNSSKWFLGVVGFTFLFIVVLALIEKCYINSNNFIYFILLMIPAILIIPGAVEYRFSLPIYIFAFAQFCYNIDWKALQKRMIGKRIGVVIIYMILLMLCLSQWTNMLANERLGSLLI